MKRKPPAPAIQKPFSAGGPHCFHQLQNQPFICLNPHQQNGRPEARDPSIDTGKLNGSKAKLIRRESQQKYYFYLLPLSQAYMLASDWLRLSDIYNPSATGVWEM